MVLNRTSFLVVAAALGVWSSRGTAARQTISFPPETATYRASDLPGYQLVQRHCLGCHSAHYASMQPPSSSRSYWEATVRKMKKPFGALFPDEDVAAMVDYLVKTYGAERAGLPPVRSGGRTELAPGP
jgi:mono/diheme cytochrome c family protein